MKSGSSAKNPYFSPNHSWSKRLLSLGFCITLMFIVLVASAETAQAGLASFISQIIGNEEASARTIESTKVSDSQISRSIVLQAPSNPTGSTYTEEVPPIDDDNTLSPEIARMYATSTEPLNTQISTYIVRSGDTISSVAKMFNVSVNTILWANDLTSKSFLKEGQTLVILPVTGINYTIKSRDTIQGIAKKFGSDVEDILNYNDLTLASVLKPGDQIIIPDAELAAPVKKPAVVKGRITRAPYEPVLEGPGWPSYPGYFSCPVPGSYISQNLHGHNGVDLAAPRGTPIRAAAAGTVIISRSNGAWNGGYGNFVVIMHQNGTQTLYAHMSKSIVYSGVTVPQGQIIGYIGMSGLTTGPHTHFEIRGAKNPFTDATLCQ